MATQLIIKDAFNVMHAGSKRVYHANLAALRGRKVSGVYAIIDMRTREVAYVGESHSGRLYDTITRHFRAWKVDPARDAQGRRRGGSTYDRHESRVIYLITPPGDAVNIQYDEILRLNPRDNVLDGHSTEIPP